MYLGYVTRAGLFAIFTPVTMQNALMHMMPLALMRDDARNSYLQCPLPAFNLLYFVIEFWAEPQGVQGGVCVCVGV